MTKDELKFAIVIVAIVSLIIGILIGKFLI